MTVEAPKDNSEPMDITPVQIQAKILKVEEGKYCFEASRIGGD